MPDCTKNYNFIYLVKQLASSKLWTFSADAFVDTSCTPKYFSFIYEMYRCQESSLGIAYFYYLHKNVYDSFIIR